MDYNTKKLYTVQNDLTNQVYKFEKYSQPMFKNSDWLVSWKPNESSCHETCPYLPVPYDINIKVQLNCSKNMKNR